jgi:hypothetical protein
VARHTLARTVTLRQAATMRGVNEKELVEALNEKIS